MMKIFFFVLTSILIKISVFIVHFVLAKYLTVTEFGMSSLYFNIVQMFVPLLTLGLIEGSIRICFIQKTTSKRINVYNSIMRMGIFYSGWLYLILFFALFLVIFFERMDNLNNYFLFVNILSSYFQFLMLLVLNMWRIIKKDIYYTKYLSACFFVYLLVALTSIIFFKLGYLSLLIASFFGFLTALYFCRYKIFWYYFDKVSIDSYLKNKGYFLNISLANFLSLGGLYIEGILLAWLASSIQVANYRIAFLMISAFYFIPSSVMSALSPRLIEMVNGVYYKKAILKISICLFIISLLIALSVSFVGFDILDYFFNGKYPLVKELLPILSVGILFFFSIKVPLGMSLYLAGYAKENLIIGFVSLLMAFVFMFIFMSIFGFKGAAYSYVFCLFLTSLIYIYYFFKKINLKSQKVDI